MSKNNKTFYKRILTLADGGSLFALQKKGNLSHVETLYNPNNCFDEVHILVFNKEDLTVRLKNPTLKVHYIKHLPFGKLGLVLSLPFMILQIIKVIHKYKIEVIRSRNAYFAGLISILIKKIIDIPVVVSLGGDNRLAQALLGHYYGGHKFISFLLEEFSLRRADRVFCVNEFTRQYAISLGVQRNKTNIVPHRLDIDVSEYQLNENNIRVELNLGDDPIIVIVGRLERDKQIDNAIEAFPAIIKDNPKIKLLCIGDGSLRTQLISRVQELNLTENILFLGFQPRNKVVKYLIAADIVLIPMSGYVIYEAAAAKKAIIAFDVEWHSEFIETNVTGMLVKNRDINALANTINNIINNNDLRIQLGKNAYEKLLNKFDQNLVMQQEIEAYNNIKEASLTHPKTSTA